MNKVISIRLISFGIAFTRNTIHHISIYRSNIFDLSVTCCIKGLLSLSGVGTNPERVGPDPGRSVLSLGFGDAGKYSRLLLLLEN